MRAVVQRVAGASVSVGDAVVGEIRHGLLVLVAVAPPDAEGDADWLSRKLVGLRIFNDAAGKFARSVKEVGGSILLVSQFTLYADTRKGRRPSFSGAAAPEHAERLYEAVIQHVAATGIPVARGRFGAAMRVTLTNDGPVTLILDSAEQTTATGSAPAQ